VPSQRLLELLRILCLEKPFALFQTSFSVLIGQLQQTDVFALKTTERIIKSEYISK